MTAWTDVDIGLLVVSHGKYDLTWKEIADRLFADRLGEEPGKAVHNVLAGR